MSRLAGLLRHWKPRGVVWRHVLRWAVRNIPYMAEPAVLSVWAFAFFVLWRNGRHGVTTNLRAILPGGNALGYFARGFRVFWNFAWTIDDAARFSEARVSPDWEIRGMDIFDHLASSPEGAIILTAHMGNYDLGAHFFSERVHRTLTTIRAPEVDPDTERWVAEHREKFSRGGPKVDYNTASTLAIDLLHALQRGEIVAIQGDRMTEGISTFPATLFGREVQLPVGPFALAMTARVPIFPLFIIRLGRRRYLARAYPPIRCERTSRDRDRDFAVAMNRWTTVLEATIREHWYQWYAFEPMLGGPEKAKAPGEGAS